MYLTIENDHSLTLRGPIHDVALFEATLQPKTLVKLIVELVLQRP